MSLGALLLAAAWTPLASATLAGRVETPVPALLAAPAALIALLAWRRTEAPPALRVSVGWAALLGAALLCVLLIEREPLAALVAPGLLVAAVATARFPAASVTGAFALTGTYGSLTALTPVPVGESIDVLLAGLWLGTLWGYLFGAKRRRVWLWGGVIAATIYIGISVFQMLLAANVAGAFFSFRGSVWYMAAFLLIFLAPWPDGTRMRIARGIVAVALVVGGYAVFRYLVGPAAAEQELAFSRTGNLDFVQYIGSFTSNKEMAVWCSQVIPFCLALGLVLRGRWQIAALIGCALLGFALLGSNTRLQLVGATAGIALVISLHQAARGLPRLRIGTTATATLGVIAAGVIGFGLATGFSEESTDKYGELFEPREQASFQARLHTWDTVLNDIDERPAGLGFGEVGAVNRRFGEFSRVADQSLDSSYLKVGLEQGFAVMVLFVAGMLALVVGLSRRAIMTRRPESAAVAIGAVGTLTALLTMAVANQSIDGFTVLAAWVIVGLGAAQFSRRSEARAALRPSPSGVARPASD